jgi:hypothetical protein
MGGYHNGPAECDECEPPEDAEPSLGSFDRMVDQTKSWAGAVDAYCIDREADDCDKEGDDCDNEEGGDDEPSLGSTSTINQEAWSFGGTYDREQGTTRRFREEPKPASICNVVPVSGEWWKTKGGIATGFSNNPIFDCPPGHSGGFLLSGRRYLIGCDP